MKKKELLEIIQEGVSNPDRNPLYEIWRLGLPRVGADFGFYDLRKELVTVFSWAIPSPEAVQHIYDLGEPVVEIGAGTGYWARQLHNAGVDIVAYDHRVSGRRKWFPQGTKQFFPVRCRGRHAARKHPDRALMLCWPPYQSSMAIDAISAWSGDTLIYVGEDSGGCTGDEAFHQELADKWQNVSCVRLPHFEGLYDNLYTYKRRRA